MEYTVIKELFKEYNGQNFIITTTEHKDYYGLRAERVKGTENNYDCYYHKCNILNITDSFIVMEYPDDSYGDNITCIPLDSIITIRFASKQKNTYIYDVSQIDLTNYDNLWMSVDQYLIPNNTTQIENRILFY